MTNEVVEYIDRSAQDHILRDRRFYNDWDGTVTAQNRCDPILEELMVELENLIGDGNARVTVSGSLSSIQEYHKAEAFVSISVACNNNKEDIPATHDLIRSWMQNLVEVDHEEMSRLRDKILPPEHRRHNTETPPPPGKQTKPAPTGLPPVPISKITGPPKRIQLGPKKKASKKPQFER